MNTTNMIQGEVFLKVCFVYSSVINTAIFCCKQFQIDCVAENSNPSTTNVKSGFCT